MTAFVIYFAAISALGIIVNLCDMAEGGLPKPKTRKGQAQGVFFLCVYLGWAIWLLAQGA